MIRCLPAVLYVLFILVGSAAFIAIAGIRVGLIAPIHGFLMIKATVLISVSLCFISFISCIVLSRTSSPKRNFYLICFLVSLFYSTVWLSFHYQRSQLPKLNDITTNTEYPLMYLRVAELRHDNEHDIYYPRDFASQQQQHYPEITSLYFQMSQEVVFKEVLKLVDKKGWEVVSLYPSEGVVEAVVTTPVFAFVDDVVIRVKPTQMGTKVDMRSSSRIGRGDYGTNAIRVKKFLKKLTEKVKAL